MLKKSDYIIISIICIFLGIAIVSQFYSSKNFRTLYSTENNDVMALEIEKIAKTNDDLKTQVVKLTKDYDSYQSASSDKSLLFSKFKTESEELDRVNGVTVESGQGVVIDVKGNLETAQIVDIINAIKNIGSYEISINGTRITISTSLNGSQIKSPYQIVVLGNSSVLISALNRKGGIVEQIQNKDIVIIVTGSDQLSIPKGSEMVFKYSRITNQ